MSNRNLEQKELQEMKEHQEYLKKVYSDKAVKLLKYSIIVFVISFITYIIGFTLDFGIIFEGLSFIMVLISIFLINHNALIHSKKVLLISLFCLAWLIVYDIFDIINTIAAYNYLVINLIYYPSSLIDYTLIANIILVYRSYISVCKALHEKEYKESTDWFYDAK